MFTQQGGEHGNRATTVRWGAVDRETAGADSATIRLATAEGEKWFCAAVCVEVNGTPQCTTAVFEVRAHKRTAIAHFRPRTPVSPPWTARRMCVCVADDAHSTPLAIPLHPPHHTPPHRRALLAARPRRIPGGIRRVHLTRSIVGVVRVALRRCVHRVGGGKHVRLS